MFKIFSVSHNSSFNHLSHQVISFPCSFTYTSKHRNSGICFCNVIDKLLNQYCFTNTGTTKQTNFTTFCVGFNQVNYLNTCEKNFSRSTEVFKSRRFRVNRAAINFGNCWQSVDWVTGNIKKAAFNTIPGRHGNSTSGINYFHSSYQSFCTIHGNTAYAVFTKVLLSFQYQLFPSGPG